MYTEANDYGCTRHEGATDMDGEEKTLIAQLDKANIEYSVTTLSMGVFPEWPDKLVHYTVPSNGCSMTVLVHNESGVDSWCENYYYFPGMTQEDAKGLDWFAAYQHIHKVWWETVLSKVPATTPCPHCGKLNINKEDTYTDIRGHIRCSGCHEIRS